MKLGLLIVTIAGCCVMAVARSHAQAAPNQNAPANNSQQPGSSAPKQDANPFPEDTSKIPVMPSKDTPNAVPMPDSSDRSANSVWSSPGDSADPVRSPDDAGTDADVGHDNVTGTSSSSSQAGMDKILPSTEGDDQPQGKHRKLTVKEPEHQETSAEDIQVGGYYLDTKNWKAALSRFESAMVLSPDEPEVYWGLAESERHLGKLAEARGYYQKVAEYDPDSKHGKEAIKALKDPEIANAKAAAPALPAK